MLEEFSPDRRVTMVANTNYTGNLKPMIDKIVSNIVTGGSDFARSLSIATSARYALVALRRFSKQCDVLSAEGFVPAFTSAGPRPCEDGTGPHATWPDARSGTYASLHAFALQSSSSSDAPSARSRRDW